MTLAIPPGVLSSVDDYTADAQLLDDPHLGPVLRLGVATTIGDRWPGSTCEIRGHGLFSLDDAETHARRLLALVALGRAGGAV
jgi:hypothetical protein